MFARTAVWIFVVCFGLRMVDVFLVRSDEWFGEQVLTKVLGLAIVLGYAIWPGYGRNIPCPIPVSQLAGSGSGVAFFTVLEAIVFLALLPLVHGLSKR